MQVHKLNQNWLSTRRGTRADAYHIDTLITNPVHSKLVHGKANLISVIHHVIIIVTDLTHASGLLFFLFIYYYLVFVVFKIQDTFANANVNFKPRIN